jgi:hypothetical protein
MPYCARAILTMGCRVADKVPALEVPVYGSLGSREVPMGLIN